MRIIVIAFCVLFASACAHVTVDDALTRAACLVDSGVLEWIDADRDERRDMLRRLPELAETLDRCGVAWRGR